MKAGLVCALLVCAMAVNLRTATAGILTDQYIVRHMDETLWLVMRSDRNGSGKLEEDEMPNSLKELGEYYNIPGDRSTYVATYDTDGDGGVSRDEARALVEAVIKATRFD